MYGQMTILDDSSKDFFLEPAMTDITVIGAGVAGLTVASQMQKQGYNVRCIEKARGTGGRLSSKRLNVTRENSSTRFHSLLNSSEKDQLQLSADLGCSQFTLSDDQINHQSIKAIETSKTEHGAIEYVATPRNSALTRELTAGIDMVFSTRVSRVEFKDGVWLCYHQPQDQQPNDPNMHDQAEQLLCASKQLIIAAPAPQAAMLLPDTAPYCDIKQQVTEVIMEPQWVAIMALTSLTSDSNDRLNNAFFLKATLKEYHSFLSFVGREDSKPERSQHSDISIWKIETLPQWSFEHKDLPKEVIAKKIQEELKRLIMNTEQDTAHHEAESLLEAVDDAYVHSHRWLYSTTDTQSRIPNMAFWQHNQLALCGDYFAGFNSRDLKLQGVSSSMKSATLLAQSLITNMAA